MDESGFPKSLKIHQLISKLTYAYSLGKMVEIASLKKGENLISQVFNIFCRFCRGN